jgi:hypothetical protein
VLGRGGNVPSLRKPHRNVGWCSSCARKKLQRVHRRIMLNNNCSRCVFFANLLLSDSITLLLCQRRC